MQPSRHAIAMLIWRVKETELDAERRKLIAIRIQRDAGQAKKS